MELKKIHKFKNILKDYRSTIIGEKFAKETMLEITNFKFIEYLESSGNPDLHTGFSELKLP